MDLLALHQQVLEWIEMTKQLLSIHLQDPLQVEMKTGVKDIVTHIDKIIENYLVEQIRTHYPTHLIMSEEGLGDHIQKLTGFTWFIDPIDGTLNFVHRKRDYGLMIAFYHESVGKLGYIYDFTRDELMYAIDGYGAYLNHLPLKAGKGSSIEHHFIQINGKMILEADDKAKKLLTSCLGTRTIGASSIEHMSVFRGDAMGYVSQSLAPWDIAAPMVIAKELGFHYSTLYGEPIELIQPKTSILVCLESVKEKLLKSFSGYKIQSS